MQSPKRSDSSLQRLRRELEALISGNGRARRSHLRRRHKQARFETLEQRRLLAAGVGNDNFGVGDQLRNYRLAVAATAEYTLFHGGQADAFTEIQNIVAGLNEVFEKELSIHLELVSDINAVFTDAGSDGYTNGDVSAMITQNTPILNGLYTNAGYDIGHVFGVGNEGGLAGLGVVNSVFSKGRGVSTMSAPIGSDFLNIVTHEVGHQFGADHTFNASAIIGGSQAREGDNAYEPASGSTLMAYAGIVDNPADNLQRFPDAYFHSASFEQIGDFVAGSGAPNTTEAHPNNIPTVNGGSDFTIPAETPFVLTASGSDADGGDTLTYTWEQLDKDPGTIQGLPIVDNGSVPLFRSFEPTTDPSRTFPRISDLAAGVNTNDIGEALPTTDRDLNFRVTVRDGNNGVNSDDVLLTVEDTGTPFAVTSTGNWTGGVSQTVTWSVADTDIAPISVANVAIDLSMDGGLTYPIELISSTPNDGSHTFNAPNINVANARVRVRALGNIFFAISPTDFAIASSTAAPGITVTETGGSTIIGEQGLVGGQTVDTYDVARTTTTSGTTTVEVTADGQTEVSSDGVNFAPSITLDLVGNTAQTVHVRGLDDSVQEGIHSGLITHAVTASTDGTYATDMIIRPVAATIADDELQPVVGVDFDDAAATPNTPVNWTRIAGTGDSTTGNLIREDGITTGIGLSVVEIASFIGDNESQPASVPLHSPDLDAIDGNRTSDDALSLTWTGLTAGRDYNIYLLTTEWFGSNFLQNISVTAGVTVADFTQDTSRIDRALLVNAGVADEDETLEADALMVQADASGEIGILVTDISAGGVEDAILSGVAIQEVGPDIVGFNIIQTGAGTEVSESGMQDTLEVVLTSQPTGNVVIDLASDDLGEATVVPASLTFDDSNWNVPQLVVFNGVDDALDDGAQSSTTTFSIDTALTTDDNFDSVHDRLLNVVTTDNESLPLVGVDFESPNGANNSPLNWTLNTEPFDSLDTNLINEAGDFTGINLDVEVTVSAGRADTPAPANLPDHPNNLANISGAKFSGGSLILTWSGLAQGAEYDLWLFAAENFQNTVIQTVTITGGGANPAPFMMDTTAVNPNVLLVNSATANPANTLKDDAVRATADSNGEIEIVVARSGGADFALLNGAAIQAVTAAAELLDFADAPTASQAGSGSFVSDYPVTTAESGARHSALGPTLGLLRDGEVDGVHSAAADADDSAGSLDDEDGVNFTSSIAASSSGIRTGNVDVELRNADANSNLLDAWIDFNRDGDWDDSGEQIFASEDLGTMDGIKSLTFDIPQDTGANVFEGASYARFRLSTVGGLAATGSATDGEVEDHQVTIEIAAPPTVEMVRVNRGEQTRSIVYEIEVTFDSEVTAPQTAFQLRKRETGVVLDTLMVNSIVDQGKTISTLTFGDNGNLVVNRDPGENSLVDGNYDLTIDQSQIARVGGGPNMASDYKIGEQATDLFFRYFTDQDGDRDSDSGDLLGFAGSFRSIAGDGRYDPDYDEDGDGNVDTGDLIAFTSRFRNPLPFV